MSLLSLLFGWLLARTIRIVPLTSEPGGGAPPSAPTPSGSTTTRRRPANGSRRPTVPTSAPAASSPPWPQVMPTGLPPFPLGWEPYEPPSGAVVARAAELLPQLWKGGAGTFKVEKTAGVWVLYRASQMGDKRGVVAYREKVPSGPNADAEREARAIDQASTAQASTTKPANVTLPTLRRGSKSEEVRILQQRLGIPADGNFGPQTESAVKAFQSRKGLTPDGIVGPKTWGALMSQAA